MSILSACATASSSRTGATARHGPHQGAQKSTRTGLSFWRTSASKVASVVSLMAPTRGLLSVVLLVGDLGWSRWCGPTGVSRAGGASVRERRRLGEGGVGVGGAGVLLVG